MNLVQYGMSAPEDLFVLLSVLSCIVKSVSRPLGLSRDKSERLHISVILCRFRDDHVLVENREPCDLYPSSILRRRRK